MACFTLYRDPELAYQACPYLKRMLDTMLQLTQNLWPSAIRALHEEPDNSVMGQIRDSKRGRGPRQNKRGRSRLWQLQNCGSFKEVEQSKLPLESTF